MNCEEKLDISICCATFNQKDTISKCLDSFLIQNVDELNVEIIIHDDCSTDGTIEILERYKKKYSNIKLILELENVFSKGEKIIPILVNAAKGKYVAFCEGDDYWTDKNKLAKQFIYMENHPGCTLCSHAAIKVDSVGNYIEDYSTYATDTDFSPEEIIKHDGNFLPTHSLFYRKDSLVMFPEGYLNCPIGDYPLQIYLAGLGYCHHFNDKMGAYRVGSISSLTDVLYESIDSTVKLRESIIHMLEWFDVFFNSKYKESFTEAIVRNQLYIFELKGNWIQIMKQPYRMYFNENSFVKKATVFAKFLFPQLYWRIRRICK